jgi:hypothetical protein
MTVVLDVENASSYGGRCAPQHETYNAENIVSLRQSVSTSRQADLLSREHDRMTLERRVQVPCAAATVLTT